MTTRFERLARSMAQRLLVLPAVHLVGAPFQVHGAAALDPQGGPYLFVANHASHLDAPAVLAALPPPIRAHTSVAAAADYFYRRRWLGALVSFLFGAFPFPRTAAEGGGLLGLRRVQALLANGQHVLLFPEGTRSRDGQPSRFRHGAGYLLRETGARAVPLYLDGAATLCPRGARLPRRGPLAVRMGAPWQPAHDLSPAQISRELQRRVFALAVEPQIPGWQQMAPPRQLSALRAA